MSQDDMALISHAVALLFENGQTTERIVDAVADLAAELGVRGMVLLHWGDAAICIDDQAGTTVTQIAATPTGVDMRKVVGTMAVIDDFCGRRIPAGAARPALEAIARLAPISIIRFALLAAAGAAALAVIFGVADWLSVLIIAASAGAGACLRRALACLTHNPFVQPFAAALLAGVVGAFAARLQPAAGLGLIAVCPCMILVPGPHLLNGMIDITRVRVPLGAARMGYAGMIIAMISAGLLLGLALGGASLPVSNSSVSVPLAYDVAAAGVAVAAYGTFFSMPWRMLPIPVTIGMTAHGLRWGAISLLGVNIEVGAFIACLVVGVVVTPVADRLRLPFSAVAFASVVSLIPGVFLFRMAGGLVMLAGLGGRSPPDLLPGVIGDGVTASLVLGAMAFGLFVPKMCIEHIWPNLRRGKRETSS
jgi:uncharacterized membrane protein YjjP (DUF1212 family)